MGVREELAEQGFAYAKAVFRPSELAGASAEFDTLIAAWSADDLDDPDYWSCPVDGTEEHSLYRIHRLESKTDWPRKLTCGPRFRELLAEVFRVPVKLTQCALTIKMPDAGVRVPWHRDPVEVAPGAVYNFSLYLDDSTPRNGCLYVLPGSHLSGDEMMTTMPAEAVPVPARAGDVVIHDVRVHHGSPQSKSHARRRAMVLEFRPDE